MKLTRADVEAIEDRDLNTMKLKADWLQMERPLGELVEKLDVVHASPEFQGAWMLYHSHGFNYTGPRYEDELDKARAFLEQHPA